MTLTPGSHTVKIAFSDPGVGVISRPPKLIWVPTGPTFARRWLEEDRWVLFAWGKGVGPAILYWGELAIFIVVAVLLGKIGQTPLRTRDWLFLGLGLSTFSWWVLLVFGVWLFVLARRSHWQVQSRSGFNALQIAVAALSIAALATVVSAIPNGLLGEPNMGHYAGMSSRGSSIAPARNWRSPSSSRCRSGTTNLRCCSGRCGCRSHCCGGCRGHGGSSRHTGSGRATFPRRRSLLLLLGGIPGRVQRVVSEIRSRSVSLCDKERRRRRERR